jgi:hypothetical protein
LHARFDLPEIVACRTKRVRSVRRGKEVTVVSAEAGKDVFVSVVFEEFTTQFNGHDFFITQFGIKATVAHALPSGKRQRAEGRLTVH